MCYGSIAPRVCVSGAAPNPYLGRSSGRSRAICKSTEACMRRHSALALFSIIGGLLLALSGPWLGSPAVVLGSTPQEAGYADFSHAGVSLPSSDKPQKPRTPLAQSNPSGEIRCTIGPAKKRIANIRLEV